MTYPSTAEVKKASASAPPLLVGSFIDQRGEPANYLGTIRGGYGNPLKNLETDQPVCDIVRLAFVDGLRARGVTVDSQSPKYHLTGIIRKLDCNQIVRREANVEIEVHILDAAGQPHFTRTYSASNLDGSILSMKTGVFASVDDLRATLERTLRETVDKALNDTALRLALQL